MHPAWSPDGRHIVFESNRDGDFEIFVMNGDGTGVRQLTRNQVDDRMPIWSPDGQAIRFLSSPKGDMHGGSWLLVSLAGGTPRPTTAPPDNDSTWSADRSSIAYTSPVTGATSAHAALNAVYLKQRTGAARLISPPGHSEEPRLSPDGRYLVFEHRRPGDELVDSRLFLFEVGRSEPAHVLTVGTNPSWSPTGTTIVFKSWDTSRGVLRIGTIRPDGKELRHLADGVLPSWSPDGRRILFMTERASQWEIMTMSPTGDDLRCLDCGKATRADRGADPFTRP